MKALTLLALWVPGSMASSSTETRGRLGFLTPKMAVVTPASIAAEVKRSVVRCVESLYMLQGVCETLGMVHCFPHVGLGGRGAPCWICAEGVLGHRALVCADASWEKVTRNMSGGCVGRNLSNWGNSVPCG